MVKAILPFSHFTIYIRSMVFYGSLFLSLMGDIVTKYLATHFIQGKTIFIINDFISLHYAKNNGIAFSLPLTGILLKIVTLGILTYLAYYYFTYEKNKNHVGIDTAFGLILGGALGNAGERIFAGEVIDFVSVKYFAIFNVADICITLGGIIYIYYLVKNKNYD